jgi:hypothetical protein
LLYLFGRLCSTIRLSGKTKCINGEKWDANYLRLSLITWSDDKLVRSALSSFASRMEIILCYSAELKKETVYCTSQITCRLPCVDKDIWRTHRYMPDPTELTNNCMELAISSVRRWQRYKHTQEKRCPRIAELILEWIVLEWTKDWELSFRVTFLQLHRHFQT